MDRQLGDTHMHIVHDLQQTLEYREWLNQKKPRKQPTNDTASGTTACITSLERLIITSFAEVISTRVYNNRTPVIQSHFANR